MDKIKDAFYGGNIDKDLINIRTINESIVINILGDTYIVEMKDNYIKLKGKVTYSGVDDSKLLVHNDCCNFRRYTSYVNVDVFEITTRTLDMLFEKIDLISQLIKNKKEALLNAPTY